jgi:hypothetical protein
MRRFTLTTICLFFLACLATTAGWAQSPHFIRASDAIITSGTDAGDLVVSWKESGLGNDVTINYTASATNASATYACVNRGSNHPQASNKENVNGPVSASGAFNSGKNGSIDASLTVEEPGPGTLSCPGGQSLVLASVSYDGVTIRDDTNGISESLPPQSVVFCDINNLTKATVQNCVIPD